MVADHAESLGVAVLIDRSDPAILESEVGRKTHELYKKGDIYGAFETWGLNVIVKGNNPLTDESLTRSVWEEIIDYAECTISPALLPRLLVTNGHRPRQGNNLHRVVDNARRWRRGQTGTAFPGI